MALALCAIAFIYYMFTACQEQTLFMPGAYQARDIRRAIDLYFNGKWIWLGPELSSGGHLPGPFYYILIGIPLRIFGTLQSVYIFEYLLAALTAGLMWLYLKKYFSAVAGFAFYLFFLSSHFILSSLSDFYNPSFLFFFLAVSVWCFRDLTKSARLLAGSLVLGLAIQIHFVAFFYFAAVIAAILASPQSLKRRFLSAGSCLAVFLAPLLPYFFFRLFLLESSSRYYQWNGAFQKVTRLFQVFYFESPEKFLTLNAALNLLKYFAAEIYFLPGLLLLFIFRKSLKKNRFLYFAFWISALALLNTLDNFGVFRYLTPFFFTFILLVAIALAQLPVRKMQLFTLAFLFVSLTVAVRVLNFSFLQIKHDVPAPMKLADGRLIIRKVISTTGWDYNYFRLHTFMRELNMWDDFSVVYGEEFVPGVARFDGAVVLPKEAGEITKSTLLPAVLADAFASGEINCVQKEEAAGFQFCFYSFRDRSRIRRWHNVGFAYDAPELPAGIFPAATSELHPAPDEVLFYRNDCDAQDPTCSIIFHLKRVGKGDLYLEVAGDPLTVIDPFNNPTMAATYKAPQLGVNCRGKTTEILIADRIGMERSGFLAPFDQYFSLPCEKPDSISIRILHGYSTFQSESLIKVKPNNFVPYSFEWTHPGY